jgi:hypothetical protein
MPVTNQLPVQFSRGMPPIEAIPSVELARLRHHPQRAGGRDRARRQRALTSCARGTVRRSTYRAPRHANRTCGALKASDDVADELSVTDAPRLAKTNPSAVRWTSPARRSASTESLTQAGADIPRATSPGRCARRAHPPHAPRTPRARTPPRLAPLALRHRAARPPARPAPTAARRPPDGRVSEHDRRPLGGRSMIGRRRSIER